MFFPEVSRIRLSDRRCPADLHANPLMSTSSSTVMTIAAVVLKRDVGTGARRDERRISIKWHDLCICDGIIRVWRQQQRSVSSGFIITLFLNTVFKGRT